MRLHAVEFEIPHDAPWSAIRDSELYKRMFLRFLREGAGRVRIERGEDYVRMERGRGDA